MTTVVRREWRGESAVLLCMSLFLGFTPVAAYFTIPGTRLWAVAFGALLGLPLFGGSLWLLGRRDVLRLSSNLETFELIQGSFLSRKGRRFAVDQVTGFHLEDGILAIRLKSGERLALATEDSSQLRAAVLTLGIPFTVNPARSSSMSPSDGTGAFD